MKFFFDNTFSPILVKFLGDLAILEKENYEITHLRQKFGTDTKDAVWIEQLSHESGWIIISGDRRILVNPTNREALAQSGLTIFVFPKDFPRRDSWEQSWRTIKIWPEIIEKAIKRPSRHVFQITGKYNIID